MPQFDYNLPPQLQNIMQMGGAQGVQQPSPQRGLPPSPQGGLPGLGGPQQGAPPSDPRVGRMRVASATRGNPEAITQVRAAIEQAVQSGELTIQELQMMVQLAETASQNPDLYPQVRAFAIQQGIAPEDQIPVEYDEGLINALLVIGEALGQEGGQPQAPAPPQGRMVPQEVVDRKGTEFFDKLEGIGQTKGQGQQG